MGEGARDQAPTVEACRGMPQHLFLGTVGGGFEACRSMLQHTENWVGTFSGKNMEPKYQSHPFAVIGQRWAVPQCPGGNAGTHSAKRDGQYSRG